MSREPVETKNEPVAALDMAFQSKEIRRVGLVPDDKTSLISADWHRNRAAETIFINNVPITEYAGQYNNFLTSGDVRRFFQEQCLKNLALDEEKQKQAVDYLLQSFTQGGYMHPVDTTLTMEMGAKGFTIDSETRQYDLHIDSTATGLSIKESVNYGKVQVNLPENPLQTLCTFSNNMVGKLAPENKDQKIVEASGALEIDFSNNAAAPSFRSFDNTLHFGHRALEESCRTGNIDQYRNQQKETIGKFLADERSRTADLIEMNTTRRPSKDDAIEIKRENEEAQKNLRRSKEPGYEKKIEGLKKNYRSSITAQKIQIKEADEISEALRQSDRRLGQIENEIKAGGTVQVFVVPDKHQQKDLMPFLRASMIAASNPAEKLFYKEIHDQMTHHPEGTQLPILKNEAQYLNKLKNGLSEKQGLVLPFMAKLKEINDIKNASYIDENLGASEKTILQNVSDRIQADVNTHIKKIMTSSAPVNAGELNAKINKHISEAEKMPHTTGLKGIFNKLFSIFHRGEKTASEDFKMKLKEMRPPQQEVAKTSQKEETPTPNRPSMT